MSAAMVRRRSGRLDTVTNDVMLRFEKRGSPGDFFVLDTATDDVVFRHRWSGVAVDRARALNVEHGACRECYGEGSVIVDWGSGPDGDVPIGGDCPRCNGSGREPAP
jgi:hypothetical protein